jgi:hypothetical protein
MTSKSSDKADTLAPVVFALHDIKPDVCLQALGQTFHVHSLVLKSQSMFFYKYLDSPDKHTTIYHGQFKYNWVTKVDEDGSWSLIAKTEKVPTKPYFPLI